MVRYLTRLAALLACLGPATVYAQGLLVATDSDQPVRLPRPIIIWPPPPHPIHPPRPIPPPPPPPVSYKIDELEVQARLVDQVAQVQVSQSFVNTGSRPLEVSFIFPLPYEGAVEQMTLLIDGREYPAKLLRAEEARRLYEQIVRRNRDPALLEWMGTGLFKTSVFPVPPGAKRTVSLRYAQLCRNSEGLTDFLFPLSTAKYTSHPVQRVEIRVTIESQQEIKNVYSPTHTVEIKRPDDRHATISYVSKHEVPCSDFRLFYDVGKGTLGARVLSYRPSRDHDGYFLLLASPQIEASRQQPARKTVVFVLDRSGSMSGKKIEQVRGALKFVLDNLREGDLFNIVAYDSQVEAFRPELQRFSDDTRKAAAGFIEGLYAGGSTNIDAALHTALAQLEDSRQPSYVIFLTDGLPTAGQTNEMQIVANAKQSNKVRARIFSFGVGYDVNSRLLEKLVRENFGQSEYVRPEEDIEDRVSRLYHRIQSPVMTDVRIDFARDEARQEEGRAVNRVYPQEAFDLFAGEQLVVVGRYKRPGRAKVTVSGSVGGQQQKFDFPADLVEHSPDESQAFVEKLWAVRRVGEILDEIDLKGKNRELIQELVELSTRHGILTPYTSFLADEQTRVGDLAANTLRADRRLEALHETSGSGGIAQRVFKGSLQRAAQAGPQAAEAMAALPAMSVGSAGPAGAGRSWGAELAQEVQTAGQTVRNIGNRAFYRREGQWVDSTLSTQQAAGARRVKQFSDSYFELARRCGRQLAQYMTFDEPVLLNVEGQAYLIEP